MPLDQSNRFYPSYQGAEDGVAGIVQLTTQGRRILLDPSSRICHGSDKQKNLGIQNANQATIQEFLGSSLLAPSSP